MELLKKVLKALKSRLGISLIINLVIVALCFILLGWQIGAISSLSFLIGCGVGALESLLTIEIETKVHN